MKKILTLAVIVLVTGCGKQRTTPYYSTETISGTMGKPIVSVLTNSDYEQQQLDKKTAHIVSMTKMMKQKDLATLFKGLDVEEVKLGLPEGVACEIIPQLRLQKTLGRLRCVQQSPEVKSELASKVHYSCSINTAKTKRLAEDDTLLYKGLNIPEVKNVKQVGKFSCTKDPKYHCGLETKISSQESHPRLSI